MREYAEILLERLGLHSGPWPTEWTEAEDEAIFSQVREAGYVWDGSLWVRPGKAISEVEWACKGCGFRNVDDVIETVVPLCGDCGQEVAWGTILPHSELEFYSSLAERSLV